MTEFTKPIENPQVKEFNQQCAELSYAIFFSNDMGKKLLQLWEYQYFYAAVAIPGQPTDVAFFNEGRNNFIRQIRSWAQTYMKNPENAPLQIERGIS